MCGVPLWMKGMKNGPIRARPHLGKPSIKRGGGLTTIQTINLRKSFMNIRKISAFTCAGLVLALATSTTLAQSNYDPVATIAAQREAMAPLAFMDGVWRGPASTVLPSGEKHNITQTERIGPFLGGSVKVIEGKGYEPDGKVSFNSFATISYNTATRAYSMHSYAQGRVGDFAFTPTAEGFSWTIPAGPTMTIRYTATVKDGTWHEVGDRIVADQPPVRFFEMTLKRIGNTDWPAGGSVAPQ
jgi:hypothetical protein